MLSLHFNILLLFFTDKLKDPKHIAFNCHMYVPCPGNTGAAFPQLACERQKDFVKHF